jgi:hypothetical protein
MVKKKAFWDTPNPAKKSTKLSEANLRWAKQRAKDAGRPWPNRVDTAAAAQRQKKAAR